MRAICGAAMLALLGGCATIIEGSDQSIMISTNPTAATCILERDGVTIATVSPTPGTASVTKSRDPIAVRCNKDGFDEGVSALSSDFEGMTFGNILFGGLVGVAVDAGSGAMNKYPETISVVLPPKSFDSIFARDQFYDGEILRAKTEAATAKHHVEQNCPAEHNEACSKQMSSIESSLAATIADLELKRARAATRGYGS